MKKEVEKKKNQTQISMGIDVKKRLEKYRDDNRHVSLSNAVDKALDALGVER